MVKDINIILKKKKERIKIYYTTPKLQNHKDQKIKYLIFTFRKVRLKALKKKYVLSKKLITNIFKLMSTFK